MKVGAAIAAIQPDVFGSSASLAASHFSPVGSAMALECALLFAGLDASAYVLSALPTSRHASTRCNLTDFWR